MNEESTQDITEESYWTKQPAEDDELPREWERADGLKTIQTKKTSFMVILPDGTELRGPKGRLRTWRNMEKVLETIDIEHPLR